MREIAKITTNVSEKIFNITNWHGVNEAPEGEARLKLGEAAVMRNFCVTSGGALKKRAGSRNVAGLLSQYVAHVKENSRKLVMTGQGVSAGYRMYPRMTANDMGAVKPAGDPAEVDSTNADQYKGYFFEHEGMTYELDGCVTTPGSGTEDITGGKATPGELEVIASGTERWTKEGGSAFEGAAFLDTCAEGCALDGEPGVRGAVTKRDPPTGSSTGFETEDVGGYCLQNGTLYRYYGVRVDSYVPLYTWKKYKCIRNSRSYTYYTQSGWQTKNTHEWSSAGSVTGHPNYSFNSSTGKYSCSGALVTIKYGGSGTVYTAYTTYLARTSVSTSGGKTSATYSENTVMGPYTGYNVSYSRGEYIGEVNVPEGVRPDAEMGYTYVTTFSDSGTSYTVMQSGEDYYCYAKDESAGALSFERAYSFHGYPLTISPDLNEWYGNETYSTANESTDTVVRGIWAGYVGGREVLCAACGGFLWELKEEDGEWNKIPAGAMDTSRDVHMFGFDEKLYILNGEKYRVWDGDRLQEVEGYRPLVSVSVEPAGGGTLLESVNRLTAGRRGWFSPDGTAKTFQLPETDIKSVDWVKDLTSGEDVSGVSYDLAAGTVTFAETPAKGVNSLEIAWSAGEDYRAQVCAMRFAETYNGAQDSRVFIYGDGSNRAFYSGLDYDGQPRADYFPDLYEVSVGDANTPITAMIRHYDKLMAFKLDSAWSIGYDTITLVDGTVTAGFYVAPVNRVIGNCAYGQAQLVQNRPRTLDGRSVIEWRTAGASGITGDQRNAERVSQRVDSSIRKFDLSRARTFYDKFSHEYYVIGEDGTAIAQNLDVDAWYVYTGLDVTCMINYRDELYFGTRDGYLRHFSDKYFSDNGEPIDAYWESGAMSFSADFRRKYSAMVWLGIKPEDNGYLEVTAQTDRKSDFAVYDILSAGANRVPEMERVKLKAKKFTYYKLILRNATADRTATVISADMRVRGTGYVR